MRNKQWFLNLLVRTTVILSLGVFCPFVDAAIEDGLVLYLSFDDNMSDASGNDNHGSCSGDSCPAYVSRGGYDCTGAFEFDGVNDYISVAENTELDGFNEVAISAWVKRKGPSVGGKESVVTKGAYRLMLDSTANPNLFFSVANNAGSSISPYKPFGLEEFKDNHWYHIAAIYDGSTVKVYIDGVEQTLRSNTDIPGPLDNILSDLHIGGRASNYYFNGTLDEVRIHSRVLSEAEILSLRGEARCGNEVVEESAQEVCECGIDGICGNEDDSLEGDTCIAQGFAGGTLTCSGCAGFDTSGCIEITEAIAVIYTPKDKMYYPSLLRIAPFTALFSGAESMIPQGREIVRWQWDFGDDRSTDSRFGEGMLVAHKFDNSGVYDVRLTITGSAGEIDTETMQIAIDEFSGTTYYVSSSEGNDDNDGLSPESAFASVETAFRVPTSRDNSVKILFKKGDVWTVDTALTVPRPSILDSYGTGNKPIIEFLSEGSIRVWRIENMHLRNPAPYEKGDWINGLATSQMLIRNCTIENGGIVYLGSVSSVVENNNLTNANRQCIYTGPRDDFIIRRNYFSGCGTNAVLDHVLYLHGPDETYPYFDLFSKNWLIENNVMDARGDESGTIANTCCSVKNVVFRDNTIYGDRGGQYAINPGLTDNIHIINNFVDAHSFGINLYNQITNARVFNNIIKSRTRSALNITGQNDGNISVFNNVFYTSEEARYPVIGIQPDAENINNLQIKNNIIQSGSNVYAYSQPNSEDLLGELYNNLYYFPNVDSNIFRIGSLSYDIDWLRSQGQESEGVCNADPDFVCDDYVPGFVDPASDDFRLQQSSPAIDAGRVPVYDDFDLNARPQGARFDIGAFEYVLLSGELLYGDVSGDGQVSASDAALAARYAVGLIYLTQAQIQAADVSGNGDVSASDASLIAQYAVGLIERFPVEGT